MKQFLKNVLDNGTKLLLKTLQLFKLRSPTTKLLVVSLIVNLIGMGSALVKNPELPKLDVMATVGLVPS